MKNSGKMMVFWALLANAVYAGGEFPYPEPMRSEDYLPGGIHEGELTAQELVDLFPEYDNTNVQELPLNQHQVFLVNNCLDQLQRDRDKLTEFIKLNPDALEAKVTLEKLKQQSDDLLLKLFISTYVKFLNAERDRKKAKDLNVDESK